MEMPARTFSSPLYRYGFNGKEKDDEAKGSGEQYDYGFRIYDPRVGRFLSRDPLNTHYPELTPYQFSGNSPITFIDLDGMELAWRNPTTGEVVPAGPINLKVGSRNANGWVLFAPPVAHPITVPKQSPAIQQPGSDYLASVKAKQMQQTALKKTTPKSPFPLVPKYTATITQQTRSKEEIEESVRQHKTNELIAQNMQTPEGQAGMALANSMYGAARTPVTLAEHGYGLYDNLRDGDYGGALKYGILLGLDLSGLRSSGLSVAEQGIVKEANTILTSTEFQVLRNAQATGTFAEVTIAGRKVLYEPNLPSSGFTLIEEKGFAMGKEAFKSQEELTKTVLQELYRLKNTKVPTSGLDGGQATSETNDAFNFAEKAHKYIKQ